jgi:L-gulonolactone oxidase
MTRPLSRRAFLGTSAAATFLTRCSLNPCPVVAPAAPLAGRGDYRFQNWAETISCRPSSYAQPGSTSELQDLVKRAAAAGKKVRVVGAGHSWSPLVLTSDVLVNLDRMQSVVQVDPATKRVTAQAGIRLKNLIPALRRQGLGLANLGSVTEQSIAGATATATHGTGLSFGSLSTQIVGMKMVSGPGEVVSIEGGDRLAAARVSLGALGIAAEVTLQCVDDYKLEYAAYWCQFDEVVEQLPTLIQENERVRLWWLVWDLGCGQNVIVTTMNPPGAPRGLLGRLPERRRDTKPPLAMETKPILKKRPRPGDPACSRFDSRIDGYDAVLTVPLLKVPHRECEYAVPLGRAAEALRACRAFFDERDVRLLMPVEVRFVRRDDTLLGPARDRDVCYIGVSVREGEYPTEVFMRLEPLLRSLEGRPHWGKFFNLTSREARELYPGSYERFSEIRREMDPGGVFANDQIRQLFG